MSGCNGHCAQGRFTCPTPEDCDQHGDPMDTLCWAIVCGLGILLTVGGLGFLVGRMTA
jgi:hypothetical protein